MIKKQQTMVILNGLNQKVPCSVLSLKYCKQKGTTRTGFKIQYLDPECNYEKTARYELDRLLFSDRDASLWRKEISHVTNFNKKH